MAKLLEGNQAQLSACAGRPRPYKSESNSVWAMSAHSPERNHSGSHGALDYDQKLISAFVLNGSFNSSSLATVLLL